MMQKRLFIEYLTIRFKWTNGERLCYSPSLVVYRRLFVLVFNSAETFSSHTVVVLLFATTIFTTIFTTAAKEITFSLAPFISQLDPEITLALNAKHKLGSSKVS